MFVSVFVVMMGFRRSVRMGSSVHAKKNLPHQLLKDKGRLQSRNHCHCEYTGLRPVRPAESYSAVTSGSAASLIESAANPLGAQAKRPCSCSRRAGLGMTGAIDRAILRCGGCRCAKV